MGTSRTKTRVNAADRGVDQPEGVAPVPASHWDLKLCLSHTWAPQCQRPPQGGPSQVLPAPPGRVLRAQAQGHGRVSKKEEGLTERPGGHRARVSASIFCSPCRLSGSGSWATLCRMAISGPPPYRLCR